MRIACVLALIAVAATAQDPDKFYSAIRENNLAQLKALLDQKQSPAITDDRGMTPLMYAAEVGSLEAMRLLIERGADVNAQNAFGSTALMWSVPDPAKVRLLLDHGANVNLTAKSGRTALIIAGFTNPSSEVVRLLLAKGAKVAIMDSRHVTPLNAATFGNDTATIRLLLDAGADIETPDTFIGLTPLMNAAGNRNLEAVRLLLAKGAKVNAVSKTEGLPKIQTGTVEFGGWTPLLMAAAFGPPEAVKTLLDAGARIDAQDYRGFTPLMLAVGTDRYDRKTVNWSRTGLTRSRRITPVRPRWIGRISLTTLRWFTLWEAVRKTSTSRFSCRKKCRMLEPPCRAACACSKARTLNSSRKALASPAMNSLQPSSHRRRPAPKAFR